jgi:hypothetical protein
MTFCAYGILMIALLGDAFTGPGEDLRQAVDNDDVDLAKSLLESGADANTSYERCPVCREESRCRCFVG